MNKQQQQNELTEADNRSVVTRGAGGGGRVKQAKVAKCMVTDGN